jgi:hypothetical protein
VYVHGVVDRDPHAFGRLRLHNRRNDGRTVPVIERRASHATRGIEQISRRRNATETLLDRLEF